MIKPDPIQPGQESVWDYPRPAVAVAFAGHVKIVHAGTVLAQSHRAVRTLETSHPPSYYFPRADIDMARLRPSQRTSICEWKGRASYFDVGTEAQSLPAVGWSYSAPTPAFAILKDHIAFYAGPFDGCFVEGERVTPQPGAFYGGWITSHVCGPFKGAPGSLHW